MEQTECSKMSAYKIQTPGNYPEENIQHTEHGESLKSRRVLLSCVQSHRWITCYFTSVPNAFWNFPHSGISFVSL